MFGMSPLGVISFGKRRRRSYFRVQTCVISQFSTTFACCCELRVCLPYNHAQAVLSDTKLTNLQLRYFTLEVRDGGKGGVEPLGSSTGGFSFCGVVGVKKHGNKKRGKHAKNKESQVVCTIA